MNKLQNKDYVNIPAPADHSVSASVMNGWRVVAGFFLTAGFIGLVVVLLGL